MDLGKNDSNKNPKFSYDKQFEQYIEMKNLTARGCNFFEHVRQGWNSSQIILNFELGVKPKSKLRR